MPGLTHETQTPRVRLVLATGLVWAIPAVLASTQQWAQLLDSPKHMSWIAAFLYQFPSWSVLWIATPLVLVLACRWPILGERSARNLLIHGLVAIVFGFVFLVVSIPIRRVFHPNGVVWEFFGPPVFKSAPQFIAVGAMAYCLLVLIGTLMDTRAQLRVQAAENDGSEDTPDALAAPRPRLVIETRVGQSVIDPNEILAVRPDARTGCVLLTEAGEIRTRASLTEMENLLEAFGFLRVHRSRVVNLGRIVEVRGGAHREGEALLDTGDVIPISRRKREDLETRLGAKGALQKGAPLRPEPAPLAHRADPSL